MDGKVLVLCDEMPGDYKDYSVKDRNYLVTPVKDPAEEPERIFVCWDSIIPEDRAFIEGCKYYATFKEKLDPNFILSQRGATNPAFGTIKGSVQEQSYFELYERNLKLLSSRKLEGADLYAEAMELTVQYPFDANQRFFEDFSRLLSMNDVVRILPAYSLETEPNIKNYRAQMLEAWKNANKFMRDEKSCAKVAPAIQYTKEKGGKDGYSDFGEVYCKAGDLLMEIYSLPIFGESPDDGEIEF